MQAKRTTKPPHQLEPGEYTKHESGIYYAAVPSGLLANLAAHEITEHEDGTLTVSPSILVREGHDGPSWHGYLEHDVWREC